MKHSYDKSYKYIGQVVKIENSADIKDGTVVLIMEHEMDCDTVYNIKSGTVDSICDEYDFQVLTTPPEERLELMYDALVSQTLTLMSEGWEMDPDSMMDLTPWITKTKIVKILLDKQNEIEMNL